MAALEREWVRTATPGHTVLATVRHAAHAWAVPWPQAAPEQAWLAAMANRYLQAVQAVLDGAPDETCLVPEAVLRELAQPWLSARGAIRWLPLGEDHDDQSQQLVLADHPVMARHQGQQHVKRPCAQRQRRPSCGKHPLCRPELHLAPIDEPDHSLPPACGCCLRKPL